MAIDPAQSLSSPTEDSPSTQPMVGKGWVQGVALVLIFGFFVMGILVYRTYTASMPMPDKVVTEAGEVLFTGADITRGQELFQARGLHEYGSVVGHGAYLGPDYTADYLRRATDDVGAQFQAQGLGDPKSAVVRDFRTNRYDPATKTLVFTDEQAAAFDRITGHYANVFGPESHNNGLLANLITDPADIHDLTAFFAWTAWASAAERPGHNYSYTNNWPAEPRVDNGPTAQLVVWSALSLIVLLGGTGIMFAVYGRWSQKIGWHSAEAPTLSFRQPGEVALTRAQRATIWFFAIISVLFLAQTLLGAAVEHYRADLTSFFGLDLAAILPYNLARTWHLQLALFWTSAAFLAGGIFLTPFIARREPRRQHWLVYGLLGAVVVVVVGSLAHRGAVDLRGHPVGFAVLPTVGVSRPAAAVAGPADRRHVPVDRDHLPRDALTPTGESKLNMPWLFFFSGLAIPMFYAVGLLAEQRHPSIGRGLLAVLGGAPVGRGLPRTVHHGDGRLHLRDARRGAVSASRWASSSSTSSCTRPAASSAPCTTCTSPELRWSTWRSGRSSPPPR